MERRNSMPSDWAGAWRRGAMGRLGWSQVVGSRRGLSGRVEGSSLCEESNLNIWLRTVFIHEVRLSLKPQLVSNSPQYGGACPASCLTDQNHLPQRHSRTVLGGNGVTWRLASSSSSPRFRYQANWVGRKRSPKRAEPPRSACGNNTPSRVTTILVSSSSPVRVSLPGFRWRDVSDKARQQIEIACGGCITFWTMPVQGLPKKHHLAKCHFSQLRRCTRHHQFHHGQ